MQARRLSRGSDFGPRQRPPGASCPGVARARGEEETRRPGGRHTAVGHAGGKGHGHTAAARRCCHAGGVAADSSASGPQRRPGSAPTRLMRKAAAAIGMQVPGPLSSTRSGPWSNTTVTVRAGVRARGTWCARCARCVCGEWGAGRRGDGIGWAHAGRETARGRLGWVKSCSLRMRGATTPDAAPHARQAAWCSATIAGAQRLPLAPPAGQSTDMGCRLPHLPPTARAACWARCLPSSVPPRGCEGRRRRRTQAAAPRADAAIAGAAWQGSLVSELPAERCAGHRRRNLPLSPDRRRHRPLLPRAASAAPSSARRPESPPCLARHGPLSWRMQELPRLLGQPWRLRLRRQPQTTPPSRCSCCQWRPRRSSGGDTWPGRNHQAELASQQCAHLHPDGE